MRLVKQLRTANPSVQILLFSATYNERIKRFAQKIVPDANQVCGTEGGAALAGEHQHFSTFLLASPGCLVVWCCTYGREGPRSLPKPLLCHDLTLTACGPPP